MEKAHNKLTKKHLAATDLKNSNHDSKATATSKSVMASKKKLNERKTLQQQMSQDSTTRTLPPQGTQDATAADTHNNTIYNDDGRDDDVDDDAKKQTPASIEYLTHNAMDNCFGNADGSCSSTKLGANNYEAATIVNIDIFDDQLSTSSLSNTSRFSCENAPLATTTPPISLNGVIDTNLMHFSHSVGSTASAGKSGSVEKKENSEEEEHNNPTTNSSSSLSSKPYRGRRHRNTENDYEDDDYDGNSSSNGSAGSL